MENHQKIADELDIIQAELLESSKRLRDIKSRMYSTLFNTETLTALQAADSFILSGRSALNQLSAEFRR